MADPLPDCDGSSRNDTRHQRAADSVGSSNGFGHQQGTERFPDDWRSSEASFVSVGCSKTRATVRVIDRDRRTYLADGTVECQPDESTVRRQLMELKDDGYRIDRDLSDAWLSILAT